MKTIIDTWKQYVTWKRMVGSLLGLLVVLFITLSFFRSKSMNDYVDLSTISAMEMNDVSTQYNTPLYEIVSESYEGLFKNDQESEIDPNFIQGLEVLASSDLYGEAVLSSGKDEVYLMDINHDVTVVHDIEQAGLYEIAVKYYIVDPAIDAVQMNVKVNGETPFYEAQTLVLPSVWEFETLTFSQDRYNNDIQPSSFRPELWQEATLKDHKGMHEDTFLFYLEPDDVMTFSYINASVLIGEVSYIVSEELATYDSYIKNFENEEVIDELVMVSARDMAERSDPSIRLRVEQDPSNLYYDTQQLRLNTIFGDSWENGGQSITYDLNVETAGLYQLSFKYRQYLLKDMPVFRRIYINGEVPFDALDTVAFPHTMNFINRSITQSDGTPYYVYLEKGDNQITLEAISHPYKTSIETMKYIMNEIQSLALDIKRYTSGGTDRFRDWDISVYFPEAENDIRAWSNMLGWLYDDLVTLASDERPSELANILVAQDRLLSIADNINQLPSRMVQFSDGDSSVNQLLGSVVAQLFRSNLELERTMVHGDVSLPSPYSNVFVNMFEGAKRLVLSFINNPYSVSNSDEDLNIWVNYPRQYIEILQVMIDQQFEGERKVTLSQMPDQNKLILANTSGQAPDIALGVDHWIPYEFAIRGAAIDLRTFEGYEDVVSRFSPGAMIPYAFEDGMFGIPSTQNFWVTFYRTDIMDSVGVTEIPSTWDDVVSTLPLLQSYGLNYFVPLAQFSGLKPFVATIPYVYQFGGNLYTESGMQTGINSTETVEGMELMSELFTLYNMPKFVGNFFNSFRYGTLPIGIGDLATYILLNAAADELDGLWAMDLHPGVMDPETGEVNRYASVGAQSNMILSQSEYPDEAWEFMEWWTSTDVQLEFAFTLLATYGSEYFWNTANLEAFAEIPMPVQHKDVIMAQWEYAIEAPRIPGSYMVEREISNAWTNIVFNGENPRQALDEAVRIANREIIYKMAEFGYALNGEPIKDYLVPTIDNIHLWLKEGDA